MDVVSWVVVGGFLLTVAVQVFNAGRLRGEVESLRRDHDAAMKEIERLRNWHHKIGDNPTETWGQALRLVMNRIDRMEKHDERD